MFDSPPTLCYHRADSRPASFKLLSRLHGTLFVMSAAPPTSQHYVGVELSAAAARAALVTGEGQVSARREEALAPGELAAQVARLVGSLRDGAGAAGVAGVGVGVPGLVNPQTGRVVISSDLPSVVRGDLLSDLKAATGLPVVRDERGAHGRGRELDADVVLVRGRRGGHHRCAAVQRAQ